MVPWVSEMSDMALAVSWVGQSPLLVVDTIREYCIYVKQLKQQNREQLIYN